jgi:GTP-binding protein
VGKSSLFNRFLGRRAAVVADRDGVTRDRHFQTMEWDFRRFIVVDTGGYLPDEGIDPMAAQVRAQILVAINEASVVLFVVDALTGLTELDTRFARLLRQTKKPVILVVNKAEDPNERMQSYEFLQLGFGDPISVSARSGFMTGNLLSRITKHIPTIDQLPVQAEGGNDTRLAILGRPNSGKSTLVNRLLGEERLIASDVAGTTRDSIDCEMMVGDKRYILTDTAGLRKKAKVSDEVEYYSNMRSIESIRRSHVCIVLIDATQGMEQQDLRIIHQVIDQDKGLIVLINKWDILEDKDHHSWDLMVKEWKADLVELEHVPMISISALTGQRVHKLLELVDEVRTNCSRILGRDRLSEIFDAAVLDHPHPDRRGWPVLMKRACQIIVDPVVVAIECSQPDQVEESWKRFMLRRLRENFELSGPPLKLNFDAEIRLRKDEELAEAGGSC